MELIIKPTGMCNFNCTFCSAHGLNIAHPTNGVPEQIKDLIQKLKPTNIIITGGEPLTVDPSYYLELQEIGKCHIGFTSNMKDFWLHPDKWKEIVCSDNFGFITSFNYGETRRWDPDTVYTEEMFIKVFNLYKEMSGKPLPFIAVIDESNEDTIMNHVYLAKRLGTQVKINGAGKMGKQGTNYPRWKILKAYIDIIDAGLDKYEMTCSERRLGKCAFGVNMLCQSTIRVCYVDNDGVLHYGNCEDAISVGEEIPMDEVFPVQPKPLYPSIKDHINEKCVICNLFRFCHGCHAHLTAAKEFPEYCDEIKKLEPDLIRQGWAM